MEENKQLRVAEVALQKFLEENPKYKEYQSIIDSKLSNLADPEDRLAVILYMLQNRLEAFQDALVELKKRLI